METSAPETHSLANGANSESLLDRAKANDTAAIVTMFRQFVPEDEQILFAEYLGHEGFLWIGSHCFACLTNRRVASIRVASFGEMIYQDGLLEDINSSLVYQPSKLGLFITIFTTCVLAIPTFGAVLLFLPAIVKAHNAFNKSGTLFCIAEGIAVFVFCDRKKLRRANELMRLSGSARAAATTSPPQPTTAHRTTAVTSIVALPDSSIPVRADATLRSPRTSEGQMPGTFQYPSERQASGTRLATAYLWLIRVFAGGAVLLLMHSISLGIAEYQRHEAYSQEWNLERRISAAKDREKVKQSRQDGVFSAKEPDISSPLDQLEDELVRLRQEDPFFVYAYDYFEGGTVCSAVAEGMLLLSLVGVFLKWFAAAWRSVPLRFRTVSFSPSATAILLCVPVFNFYWVFRAIPGLARSLDWAGRDVLNDPVPMAGRKWAVAGAILCVIPGVNLLVAPFILGEFVKRADRVKNRLIEASLPVLTAAT